MIKVIKHENMGRSDRGWLHSLFHFSFAEYYKPDNIKFGALRVVNDEDVYKRQILRDARRAASASAAAPLPQPKGTP